MATQNATNTANPVTVAQGGTGDASVTAYAVLCGGTTSTGAVQSVSGVGTSGQVLTSAGASALPTWATPVTGAWNLLNTLTASASSSLIFTSTYITSTYTTYAAVIRGINNASGSATLRMNLSVDNSTYLSSNFQCGCLSNNYNGTTFSNANSTSTCPLTPSITNTSVPINGIIYLYFPASSTASYNGQLFITDTTSVYAQTSGINSGTTTINNIQFIYSTGNITSGTISLYGIAK